MKRIIFVNRFFYPDHSATSQILSDLAFHLAACGHDVHVVTSRQRYDDPDARLPPEQTECGVHIHRIATTRFGRARLLGRAIDYLGFYRALRGALRTLLRPGDVVVAKTDPPLISVVAMAAAARSGARSINWVQDLYPEVAVRLGVPYLRGPVSRVFTHWRDRSLQFAATNVVISERMAEAIVMRGVPPERIHVIPNWCDDEVIMPMSPQDNPLRRQWPLQDQFVVGYSGNLGRAHEFDTIVGAAAQLKAHPDIAFLFIGAGHALQALRHRLAEQGLDRSFRFKPYQDRGALKDSLSVPDCVAETRAGRAAVSQQVLRNRRRRPADPGNRRRGRRNGTAGASARLRLRHRTRRLRRAGFGNRHLVPRPWSLRGHGPARTLHAGGEVYPPTRTATLAGPSAIDVVGSGAWAGRNDGVRGIRTTASGAGVLKGPARPGAR
jgi:glycosyltransferase involved in cell wall biosynthesis